jgi:CSLREA domain-containing protein
MWHRLTTLVAATALFLLASESALAATITVNTALDDNGGNAGLCSLREAIVAVNTNADVNGCTAGSAAPTVDVIQFAIDTGPQTLLIDGTTLPDIVEPVTIDGATQPGVASSPVIEIRRGTAPEGRGLTLKSTASNSTIRGLALNNWTPTQNIAGRALTIDGASNCVIEGNWFGIRLDASIDGGNVTDIEIRNGAKSNRIGGTTASARNVIVPSGHGTPSAIVITGTGTDDNVVQGNYIHVDPTGTAFRGLSTITVLIALGAKNTIIGGAQVGAGNLIAGNLVVSNSAPTTTTGTKILGNRLGTNASGETLLTRGDISAGGNNTQVGGPNSGEGNLAQQIAVPTGITGAVIQGNLVGVTGSGAALAQNSQFGIFIQGTGTQVGGPTVGARNVVANSFGISVAGTGAIVEGNFVGTNPAGTQAFPNSVGMSVSGSDHRIGGPAPGAGNLISGNTGNGISLSGGGHTIAGNLIGVAADGVTPLGNGEHGILVDGASTTPVTIGGTSAGSGNVIVNNPRGGVSLNPLSTRQRVSILGNSIYSNGTNAFRLGIDLRDNGVTPNDAGDGDTGPNNLQNFPVLTSATVGSGTTIVGTLNSTAGTSGYRIELFGSPTCDASGFGEGRTFLGSTTANTDGGGDGSFSATVSATLSAGTQVTATATDPQGNTSEFSQCLAVTGDSTPPTPPNPPTPPTSCSPRPPVQVTSTRGTAGTLNVTVRAGSGSISLIDFGAPRSLTNASVSVQDGPQSQAGDFTFTPADGATSTQFTVTAANRGLPTTVALTVTDACGAWKTFVGGGAGSF